MYNIYDELNKVTDYIEEHILEDIDIKVLTKITGLNINNLKNIFLCLTGISLVEYIRLRRLSLSVTDILNGESITSISYKYLYNSPSSYNRAFKKYEGVTPRKIRKNIDKLKLFNKITFNEKIKDYNIGYKIYKNKSFTLYGISKEINYNNRTKEIPNFWKEIKSKYPEFTKNRRYGYLYINNDNERIYYCLLENKFENSKKINIPICNYFAIKSDSFKSEKIIENINKGIKEYIKSLNYKILDLPIIEVYHVSYVEILIPIS